MAYLLYFVNNKLICASMRVIIHTLARKVIITFSFPSPNTIIHLHNALILYLMLYPPTVRYANFYFMHP